MSLAKKLADERVYGPQPPRRPAPTIPPRPSAPEPPDDQAEARRERWAIQDVERESRNEFVLRAASDHPRPFAPPIPGPDGYADPPGEFHGLAMDLRPWTAIAAADRRAAEEYAAGRIGAYWTEYRAEHGPPEPPGFEGVHTGWYQCNDAYFRVGEWPFPEYRPPGLRWRLYWRLPKPADVPWDEPDLVAKINNHQSDQLVKDRRLREPTGVRAPSGDVDQLLFGFG